jgi:4-diphosphocytidyl-2-C-methyl-D-erythritol kinase
VTALQVAAPGKLNLCLHLGPTREDGLHEIASLFESVSLADTLTATTGDGLHDRVICADVLGENLAETALRSAREAGLLSGAPLNVELTKRVPIAAGMGGGSGDAAAALRIAAEIEGRPLTDYEHLAFTLGADVPSQLVPGAALVHGAGERVTVVDPAQLAGASSRAYVIVEQKRGLSTADVFRQCDRAELPEPTLVQREEDLIERLAAGVDLAGLCELIENAMTPAIEALRPELAGLPRTLAEHGALAADFTGSGPTCFGVFDGRASAEQAAAALESDGHIAHVAVPVDAEFASPRQIERAGR